MTSKIMNKHGETSKRLKSNRDFVEMGSLKSQFLTSKSRVGMHEDLLIKEQKQLESLQKTLTTNIEELAILEESIDMNPLPEGAQPVILIQKRDKLRLVSTF